MPLLLCLALLACEEKTQPYPPPNYSPDHAPAPEPLRPAPGAPVPGFDDPVFDPQNAYRTRGIAAAQVPHPSIARYSGRYTHIVIKLNTQTGAFGVEMDGEFVYEGRVSNAEWMSRGIGYLSTNSGRGGNATDSYIDELTISAKPLRDQSAQ
ncbi:MAG: hypothetical protein JXR96_02455 [Deltaproteobacteria bacterium]|nr:hypothetical protein [Deltaproteobacteria bacterium]